MNDYQHIESYMRTRTRTLAATDWYQAGIVAGTAPTEWEMVEYGRDTALGWLDADGGMDAAITKGFKAMYVFAYGDIRDSITRTGGLRRPVAATSATDVYVSTSYSLLGDAVDTSYSLYDVFDWIARADLSADQRRIVVLYSLGWKMTEISTDLGLAATSVRRWFKKALPILEKNL